MNGTVEGDQTTKLRVIARRAYGVSPLHGPLLNCSARNGPLSLTESLPVSDRAAERFRHQACRCLDNDRSGPRKSDWCPVEADEMTQNGGPQGSRPRSYGVRRSAMIEHTSPTVIGTIIVSFSLASRPSFSTPRRRATARPDSCPASRPPRPPRARPRPWRSRRS